MTQIHRVIVATDIPFWLLASGAQQRMAALSRMFRRAPFELQVFYLGTVSDNVMAAARVNGISVVPLQCGKPTGLLASAISIVDRFWKRRRPGDEPTRDVSLTLADYAWPLAKRQFAELLRQHSPRTVILEYVTMSYLAPVVRETAPGARLVLDSHDVLHRRYAQFTEAGYRHWLRISEPEEIEAVRQFDVVLAIQNEEAEWFRHVAPGTIVLTVGHCFDFDHLQPTWRRLMDGPFVIGYFGSNNGSNVDAITNFMQLAWPRISAASGGGIELLIGGSIVDSPSVKQCAGVANVRLQRDFASPSAFYADVDLIINPVRFGTGLKIKTVEALAHGRPVVTTTAGRIGISTRFDRACVDVDSLEQMVDPIVESMKDRVALAKLSQSAYQLAKTEFSEGAILSEFRRLLLLESEPRLVKTPSANEKMLE